MLFAIGRHPSAAELVELLAACHARIRHHLAIARRLATEADPPLAEVREAASAVRRYFSIALPLHIADEEHSIAPKLRANRVVATTMATVEDQHSTHAPMIEWLISLTERLERHPERLAEIRKPLLSTLTLLQPQLEEHLELEERILFPAVARLDDRDQAEILAAIRSRRADA